MTGQLPQPETLRVVVVVDWRRQRVHGLTTDNAKAQQWTREIIAKHDGDPLAATMTVGLVGPTPSPWAIAEVLRAFATGGGPCRICTKPLFTHVCLGCSPDSQTPGPGCGDCRYTGMDQTPCLPPTSTPKEIA